MNFKKSIFDFNNFLIINTAFIGDVALSVYIANEIKVKHPNSNISFLTTPNSSSLLKPIKAIDSILIYNKKNEGKSLSSIKTKADMLSKLGINCIINPHQSFRTSLLTHYVKSEYKIGYKSASLNFVYNCKIEYKKNRHSIFRNLELLKGFKEFNNISEYSKVELNFNDTDLELVDNILLQNGVSDLNRVVAIAPASAWKTKEWNESHFIDLCKKLKEKNYEIVVIGSKLDFEKCQRISYETFSSNLSGKLDLDQTLILLSNSKLLISNDSSPVHLAGIVNTPTIEIFGPTSPIFGFGPSSDKFKIIENNNLICRPCNIHGENICPLGTHECMTSLSPDDIMKEIENII